MTSPTAPVWVPDACTLPTRERPLRVAEFDALFSDDVTDAQRPAADHAKFDLRPDAVVAARAADLAARETGCCSFFEFSVIASAGRLTMHVRTSPEHVDVLDALIDRARAATRKS